MDTSLNHIRQTVIPNLERPGGTGKVKLTEAEKKVFVEARSDMVNYPVYFGAGAFGMNYAITYPLRNTKMKWVRIPLNLLAGGFGLTFGFNRALEKLILNLYSLPDSPIAKEGRELLEKKDPNHPLLKSIKSRMASKASAGALALGSQPTASSWKEETFSDAPATAPSLNSLVVNDNQLPKDLKPLALGSASSVSSPLDRRESKKGPDSSSASGFLREKANKDFHGEDALSFPGWQEEPPRATAVKEPEVQKPTLASQKSSGRTWDEVRAEYQRRKSQS